ncbi:hypothetical protein [Sphingobacterium hotanense]|uniref:hypothetical protein n=1 Tax=Sphingobacterium hotanense TaxID=649196 RepID=UPI0021A82111|nr:hypothetical protein [Sphingobacterium hotanense]MCT1524168.1 hypothetical protein [Sphingobacterium hotanense]
MKVLLKPLALLGFVVVFLSSIFCPFLNIPLKKDWNLYQVDTALFLITMGILGLNVLLFFMRKLRAFQISSIALLAWLAVALTAVYFQINNYFGMKLIDGLISKAVTLSWGWIVIFVGAVLISLSVRTKGEG